MKLSQKQFEALIEEAIEEEVENLIKEGFWTRAKGAAAGVVGAAGQYKKNIGNTLGALGSGAAGDPEAVQKKLGQLADPGETRKMRRAASILKSYSGMIFKVLRKMNADLDDIGDPGLTGDAKQSMKQMAQAAKGLLDMSNANQGGSGGTIRPEDDMTQPMAVRETDLEEELPPELDPRSGKFNPAYDLEEPAVGSPPTQKGRAQKNWRQVTSKLDDMEANKVFKFTQDVPGDIINKLMRIGYIELVGDSPEIAGDPAKWFKGHKFKNTPDLDDDEEDIEERTEVPSNPWSGVSKSEKPKDITEMTLEEIFDMDLSDTQSSEE